MRKIIRFMDLGLSILLRMWNFKYVCKSSVNKTICGAWNFPGGPGTRAGASTEHTSTSTGKSVLEYSVFSIFMFIILGKMSTRVVLAPALPGTL